jgi:sortase A
MKTIASIFLALALFALGYWALVFGSARLYQAREMPRFVSERPAHTVEPAQPLSRGSAVALLGIPRLGVSVLVLEGADERELKLGAGHITGTSLPGDGGNVGVAGHRDTFFRPLRHIRKDDNIQVKTHDREYLYTVVSTEIVAPEDVQVLNPLGHEALTLVTCYPFNFVGSAPKRFIVRADCTDCEGVK